MNFIKISNLVKEYPKFRLGPINLNLTNGKIIGLIGINGSGKTTLIKSILNLVNINSGHIEVFGDNILSKNERKIKDKLGIVLDSAYYYKGLTIKETAKIYGEIYSTWSNELFIRYCEEFGLDLSKKIDELSKGMKMKLSVAIAISKESKGLIMDEPTGGLDPLVRKDILKKIKSYVSENDASLLFSTHITSDLDNIADEIVLLHSGKIIFYGSKLDFKKMYVKVTFNKNRINDNIIGIQKLETDTYVGFVKNEDASNFDNCSECTIEEVMLLLIEGDEKQ